MDVFWILIGLIIQFSNGLSASLLTAQYNIILAARSETPVYTLVDTYPKQQQCIRFTYYEYSQNNRFWNVTNL